MLPEGWEIRPLAFFVSSLDAGISVNSEDRTYRPGEVGVLKTSALTGACFNPNEHKAVLRRERQRVKTSPEADSIIVSRMNTFELVGQTAYIDKDYPELFLPDRLWLLRFWNRDILSVKWLNYVISSETARAYIQINATGTSGSMKNLPKEKFLKMPLICPPVKEQHQIAEIINTLDEAIAHTSSIITKLKHIKAGLLNDLLTRGLDENGELRDENAHSQQFKDSPLGRIPIDWEFVSIADIATDVTDGDHHTPARSDSGVFLLSARNVLNGRLALDDVDFVPEHEYQRMIRRCYPESGDILISCSGTVGRVCEVPEGFRCVLVRSAALVKLNQIRCQSRFIEAVLQSNIVQAQILREQLQAAQPNLFQGSIKRLSFPLPPFLEQARIAQILDSHETRIRTEETYLEKLKLQKKGLMNDLLTGRVRVNTSQKISA